MKLKYIFLSIIFIVLLVSLFFGLSFLKSRIDKSIGLDKDIFKNIAISYYNEGFHGVVKKKFIDSTNHNYKKIVLRYMNKKDYEVRLDYEWLELFRFIKIGDTISKEKRNLDIRLKRKELDTMIRLNFSNIKNSQDYIDFLYELDSIYDR